MPWKVRVGLSKYLPYIVVLPCHHRGETRVRGGGRRGWVICGVMLAHRSRWGGRRMRGSGERTETQRKLVAQTHPMRGCCMVTREGLLIGERSAGVVERE
eukprot:756299-Hanusia_phi.AAC.2